VAAALLTARLRGLSVAQPIQVKRGVLSHIPQPNASVFLADGW
jgi:hypothetical protein